MGISFKAFLTLLAFKARPPFQNTPDPTAQVLAKITGKCDPHHLSTP
jgi:hypothetical protein